MKIWPFRGTGLQSFSGQRRLEMVGCIFLKNLKNVILCQISNIFGFLLIGEVFNRRLALLPEQKTCHKNVQDEFPKMQ
jgi:hypothetical protein